MFFSTPPTSKSYLLVTWKFTKHFTFYRTEIHSISKSRQQRLQQLNKHQQQLLQQRQQELQQEQQQMLQAHHTLRQQQLQQQQLQLRRMQPTHSTPLANGMIRGSNANDTENQIPLRLHTAKKRPFAQLENSYQDNDSESKRTAAFNMRKTPPQRLSPRELKYNAFGSFVSSSLMDLPQKMALELVEKFTSDIVKALTMKMDEMEENLTDAPVDQ